MNMRKARQQMNERTLEQRAKQRLDIPYGYLRSTNELSRYSLMDILLSLAPASAYSFPDMLKDVSRAARERDQT